jgi:hypothetical protein
MQHGCGARRILMRIARLFVKNSTLQRARGCVAARSERYFSSGSAQSLWVAAQSGLAALGPLGLIEQWQDALRLRAWPQPLVQDVAVIWVQRAASRGDDALAQCRNAWREALESTDS